MLDYSASSLRLAQSNAPSFDVLIRVRLVTTTTNKSNYPEQHDDIHPCTTRCQCDGGLIAGLLSSNAPSPYPVDETIDGSYEDCACNLFTKPIQRTTKPQTEFMRDCEEKEGRGMKNENPAINLHENGGWVLHCIPSPGSTDGMVCIEQI